MHLPPTVDIREVGLRDGLQLEAPVSTEAKLAVLEAVAATGVSRVEVTSFVSRRAVPALADAEQVPPRGHVDVVRDGRGCAAFAHRGLLDVAAVWDTGGA